MNTPRASLIVLTILSCVPAIVRGQSEVVPTISLPVDDSTTWLGLQLHRTHMDSLITPRGHRIGVASWQTFGPVAWPFRQ